jgi:hypothetical protein
MRAKRRGKLVYTVKTDAPLSVFLELTRWRHDFPPPQNIVARQLAAASIHQVVSKEKESLVWLPDSKQWESSGTHDWDWLLFDFLLSHDTRRAGPWQQAKAQSTLSNLFHVRFPMAAPKLISLAHDISTNVSSRDLSDLKADVPSCWNEPIKPFTVRYVDWDGRLRKIRIKPKPSMFKHIYANPKFPLNDSPICDDRKHYFAKERMQREGVQFVQRNVVELLSDALGGARFKPIGDPLEYLKSFVAEQLPLYPTAPDPRVRHQADMDEFTRRASIKCPHGVYDPHGDARYCSVCKPRIVRNVVVEKSVGDITLATSTDLGRPTKTQVKAFNKLLVKDYEFHGPELSGLKWQAPKQASISCPAEKEVERTQFEEALRDAVDADVTIINADDSEYLRKLGEHGEVFRRYYGSGPDLRFPELKRDLYLFETALSKDWKSDAERKEWQRRLDMMHCFIHKVCPTGTCLNNRCANPKLKPYERMRTHALNLLQKVAPDKAAQLKVGTYYLVVVLQGQPQLKILKAKTAEQADKEIQRLIVSSVTKARADARRQKTSEKAAEQRIRDAYRVADRLYCATERYPESHLKDVAAD